MHASASILPLIAILSLADSTPAATPKAAPSATTTILTLPATAIDAGKTLTLTAKIKAGSTAVAPGIVRFCNASCQGSGLLGTAVLGASGAATRSFVLPAGSYSLLAAFDGTTPYAASASVPQSLTVQGASTYAAKAVLSSVTGTKGKYAVGASLSTHGAAAPTGSLTLTDATNSKTLGSVALPASPLGAFQPFGLISTGAKSGPNDLATGDFNGDGVPDLSVPDSATGVVAVFLGKGDGTFAAAVNYSTGTASAPLAIAVGDLNADGHPDLAVALGSKSAVAILLGNADGTFQTPRFVPTAGSALYYPIALVLEDFNHDGRLDLATANNNQGASLLLGNGDGTFQTFRPLTTSKQPSWIAAADLDNDGKLDLALPTESNTVDILLGNGDGTFQTFTSIATGNGTLPESVAVTDLDGDGNLDLLVACYGANALGVLLGNGDGTFLPIELYGAGNGPISVSAADLDRSGNPGVIVTDLAGNGITLFAGNGDGTLTPLPGYSTTSKSQPAATLALDLDANGTPELVSVLYGASAIYILEAGRTQGVVLRSVALSAQGTLNLTATYPGDSHYAAATSKPYQFTASSTTTVAPAFSPMPGTFTAAQTVTLSSSTTGAKIYYTLDNTAPTTASRLCSGPLTVSVTQTISAIAVATGLSNSSVATGIFTIQTPAAAPSFSPPAGTYAAAQRISLATTTPNATIYYTLNGSAPTTSSAKYTGPIAISASATLSAIATATGSTASPVSKAIYTFTLLRVVRGTPLPTHR